jgi:hypothetical protein
MLSLSITDILDRDKLMGRLREGYMILSKLSLKYEVEGDLMGKI